MARQKVWESRAWLHRKFVVERMSEKEIAAISGASQQTINRWINKFGLRR